MNDIGECYEAASKALLRLELAVHRDLIRELSNNISESIRNIDMVGFLTNESRGWFEKYIKAHFLPGDYYYLSNMQNAIERSKLNRKLKYRMLNYSEMQCAKRTFTAVRNEMIQRTGSTYKLNKMLDAYRSLDIYPISISYRDKHGEKAVAGLYKIFAL